MGNIWEKNRNQKVWLYGAWEFKPYIHLPKAGLAISSRL